MLILLPVQVIFEILNSSTKGIGLQKKMAAESQTEFRSYTIEMFLIKYLH